MSYTSVWVSITRPTNATNWRFWSTDMTRSRAGLRRYCERFGFDFLSPAINPALNDTTAKL